jgi:hypothetical protein
MKDVHLRVDDTLSLDNEKYLHIKKVEVFTGDDEYNETDCIEVEAHKGNLLIKQMLTRKNKPSCHRLRGEPGIRVHVAGENGKQYILAVAHHKGNIQVSAKEISNEII